MMLAALPGQTGEVACVASDNVGSGFTVTTGVLVICRLQPKLLVASTLNVVVVLRLPVGKLIAAPVAVTGAPIRLLSALLRNW